MNKSRKIIRNSILTGILGGVLFTIVVLYLGDQGSNAIRWSKLPSPVEELATILQIGTDGESGMLLAKSGNVYSCKKNNESCVIITPVISQDEISLVDICKHDQIDEDDEDFRQPPSQPGRVVYACKSSGHDPEVPSTLIMLLYEDNSLWLGESGGAGFLPMYGAEFFVGMIFCMGSFVCFFLGWGFFLLQAKFRQRSTIPMQTD